MRLRGVVILVVAVAAIGLASAYLPRPAPRPVEAAVDAPPRSGIGPGVALLVTRPGATSTTLQVARAGDASPGPPLCAFDHLADAAVRGTVLPGPEIAVLATADAAAFTGTLFRLAAGRPPEILADRIARGARALITPAGRVFVSRGKAGAPGADELTVDEIDPRTHAARTVHAASGALLVLAGAFAREIVLYRVGPAGADLAAVDPDSGAVRVILPQIPPYARDFSVDPDAGALVFQARDPVDGRAFTVERVDIATGARRRVYAGTSMSLAPFAWPGGGVAYNHEGRAGLALLGGTRPLAPGPLGAGVDLVQAVSAGRAWVAGLHTVPGALPAPFTLDTRTGVAAIVPSPAGARATVAGFVGGDPG